MNNAQKTKRDGKINKVYAIVLCLITLFAFLVLSGTIPFEYIRNANVLTTGLGLLALLMTLVSVLSLWSKTVEYIYDYLPAFVWAYAPLVIVVIAFFIAQGSGPMLH